MKHTQYFKNYLSSINELNLITKNDYSLKLLYANVITLMESYLMEAFVSTIKKKKDLIIKVVKSKLFNKHKVTLETAYTNNIEQYIISNVKQIIFHKLYEVFILYKDVLGINFKQNGEIIESIKIRHDIVHRNGKDLMDNTVPVTPNDLDKLIENMNTFLREIDLELYDKYYKMQKQL